MAERASGSTWIDALIYANFALERSETACPNKHDFDLSVPSEFAALGADTLVVVVAR